jgi:hypothetical protein
MTATSLALSPIAAGRPLRRHLSDRHIDVDVASGACWTKPTASPELTLMDLNPNSLFSGRVG